MARVFGLVRATGERVTVIESWIDRKVKGKRWHKVDEDSPKGRTFCADDIQIIEVNGRKIDL